MDEAKDALTTEIFKLVQKCCHFGLRDQLGNLET